jgi:hypothetical protein
VRLLTRCITTTDDITEETGMSFEYLADPSPPTWEGLLPGTPAAHFGDIIPTHAHAERFFQQMGTPAETIDPGSPPFIPDLPRMQAAAQAHRMEFRPDFTWSDA